MHFNLFWHPFFCRVILRDEIKYVQMDGELMMKEKAAIGRKDIVVGYVHSPGSPGMSKT